MHRTATSITQMDTYYTQERVFRKLFSPRDCYSVDTGSGNVNNYCNGDSSSATACVDALLFLCALTCLFMLGDVLQCSCNGYICTAF